MVSKPATMEKVVVLLAHLARGARRPCHRWHSGRLPDNLFPTESLAESANREAMEPESRPFSACAVRIRGSSFLVGRRPHRLEHELAFSFQNNTIADCGTPFFVFHSSRLALKKDFAFQDIHAKRIAKEVRPLLDSFTLPEAEIRICDHPSELEFRPFRIPPSFFHWSEAIPRFHRNVAFEEEVMACRARSRNSMKSALATVRTSLAGNRTFSEHPLIPPGLFAKYFARSVAKYTFLLS